MTPPADRRPPAAVPAWTALRRTGAVALVAAALTTTATLPGAAGQVVPAAVSTLGVLATSLVLLRTAGTTAHPAAWRWYAAGLTTAITGSALGPWAVGTTPLGVLGAVPGQLLFLAALLRLRPHGTRHGLAHALTSLALFVVASLLGLHTVLHLAGRFAAAAPLAQLTANAAVGTVALVTGAALLLATLCPPARQPVARRLLAAQGAMAVVMTLAVLDLGELPAWVRAATWPCVVVALAALGSAVRRDRACAVPTAATAAPTGAVAALLPHAMVLVGGLLFTVHALVQPDVDLGDVLLAGTGLVLLLVHQVIAWRATERITGELQRSSARARALVRASSDPVLIVDDQLRITFASPAVRGLFGHAPESVVGHTLGHSLHPDDTSTTLSKLGPSAGGETVRTARVRHADGTWRLIQCTVRDLRDDPDVGALVLYCRDVTRAPVAELADAEAPELSTLDAETGLPNRAALARRVGALGRAARSAHGEVPAHALVVIGVAGLDGGDVADLEERAPGTRAAVLQETTARLARGLRGEDWLARGNGGDFAAVVEGTLEEAKVVAARLVADVQPVTTSAGTVRLTAAAGVATLLPDTDAGEALRHADLALRTARAEGPGRVRCYDDALRMVQDRRARLREDLSTALRRGELRLVFQPIVDLALHRTSSVEALLRWRHPEFGEVSPAEFVPLAEESAFIGELSRWVLTEASRTATATGDDGPAVAVNLSARHVRGGELVHDVVTALERTGLPAGRLVLEITESLLLDEPHVVEDLQALRSLGCRIAVDDFGTGWSSLAYLVDLPIDVLKMDRQFLAGFDSDPQRRALCRAVLQLGASLDMAVVVEGVETAVELALLRDMGHRFLQGFLLSRPLERPVLLAGGWTAAAEVAAAPVADAPVADAAVGAPGAVVPSPRTVPLG